MKAVFDAAQVLAGYALMAVLLFGVANWAFGDFVSDLFEAQAAPVKKSRSGICHCPGGRYYARTKTFTAYSTIKACLDSGGRPPKRGQGDCEKATVVPGTPESFKRTKRKIEPQSTLVRPKTLPRPGLPLKIVDGDTIVVNDIRVRLHGIDAPEMAQSCRNAKAQPYKCGEDSKSVLMLLAAGGVRCEPAGDERDRYNRWIAICYAHDGASINAAMVRTGYALAYRKYSTEYVAEEEKARDGKKGIHRGRFVPPWDWRRGQRLK